MTWFSVDVEANGPAPGLFSMLSLGAVAVRDGLHDTFYVELQPLPGAGVNEQALAVSDLSMEHLSANGKTPHDAMGDLAAWIVATAKDGAAVLVSDNPGFDAAFITYYFALAGIPNPFGHSSRRIGDLYAGFKKGLSQSQRMEEASHKGSQPQRVRRRTRKRKRTTKDC